LSHTPRAKILRYFAKAILSEKAQRDLKYILTNLKNNKMKTLLFLGCFALMASIIYASYRFEVKEQKQEILLTDIEIYTPENIYYINGLTVTNENDGQTLEFKDKESLKEYISDKTADDTQKCADQWKRPLN